MMLVLHQVSCFKVSKLIGPVYTSNVSKIKYNRVFYTSTHD